MNQFVEAVKRYAVENYERDGWDFVVECWSYEDINDCILGAATEAEAIQLVADWVKPVDEYRAEVEATVW